MRKNTYEEVYKEFQAKGFELLDKEYSNTGKRMKCVDKDGYLFSISLDNLRIPTTYVHIFNTNNPYCFDNIKHYMEKEVVNGTLLLSTEYKGRKDKMDFKCGECGKPFSSLWESFRATKHKVCPSCYKSLKQEGKIGVKRVDSSEYLIKVIENGLYPLFGEITDTKEKILVQDKDGYMGLTKLYTALSGGSFDRYSTKNPYTITNLRLFCAKNGYDCIILDQVYKGDREKLRVVCSCGERFETTISHIVHDKKYKCNKCTHRQSNIEGLVQNYLSIKNIDFIMEYKYQDCRNKEPLPFDFYLPQFNALIEVDGVGHYKPTSFNGNESIAQSTYESTVQNDSTKNQYCKDNNIPLLRIPYWDFDTLDYQSKINKFLSIED